MRAVCCWMSKLKLNVACWYFLFFSRNRHRVFLKTPPDSCGPLQLPQSVVATIFCIPSLHVEKAMPLFQLVEGSCCYSYLLGFTNLHALAPGLKWSIPPIFFIILTPESWGEGRQCHMFTLECLQIPEVKHGWRLEKVRTGVLTLDTTDSLGGYIIKHDDGNYDFDIFFLR